MNIVRCRPFLAIVCTVAVLFGITATAQETSTLSGKLAKTEQRAFKGFASDQWKLAEAYMKGDGVAQDFQRAAFWYERAAESGLPAAQVQIGYLYSSGTGVKQDLVRAVHWYQLAAASGTPMGKLNLGVMYLHGRGVRQDYALARKYFSEAAERGEGAGAAYLGVMDFDGTGGPVDWPAAERWFKLGFKLHNPIAAYELGLFYVKCDKRPHDLQEVLDLLRFSSGKGYVDAKYLLASVLLLHPKSADSPQEPAALLQEASAAGQWHATALLAEVTYQGIGIPADAEKAYYYLKLAVLQGGSPAEKSVRARLAVVEASLSEEVQARHSELAKTWYNRHERPLLFLPGPETAIPVVSMRARSGGPAQ